MVGAGIIARVVLALLLAARVAGEYDGRCDDDVAAGAIYATLHTSVFFSDGCDAAQLYSAGTTMNYESLNCGSGPGGSAVCVRCVGGAVTVGSFALAAADVFAGVASDDDFLSLAAATAGVDCNDGCGDTCYALGDHSFRLSWNSADAPLCASAPVCPNAAVEEEEEEEEAAVSAPAPRRRAPPLAVAAAVAFLNAAGS